MKLNSLYIYQTGYQQITDTILDQTDCILHFNYIDFLKEHSHKALSVRLNNILQNNSINIFYILFDNNDSSLDIYMLKKFKEKYNLKLVCLFFDSLNSFEYIDRYYAQLADLVIIDNTPYIKEFYDMLEIYTEQVPSVHKTLNIRKNNIFASELNHLCSKIFIKVDNPTPLGNALANIYQKNNKTTFLLDSKFIYTQKIYKYYWILYHFLERENIFILCNLLKLKNFKNFLAIIKLYITMKSYTNLHAQEPINIINKALYKEYLLKDYKAL